MKISVIIPAHNEAGSIERCIDSIRQASRGFTGQVEIVVVLNRCTDATESIARESGAKLVREDSRNLAVIRIAGFYLFLGRGLNRLRQLGDWRPLVFIGRSYPQRQILPQNAHSCIQVFT